MKKLTQLMQSLENLGPALVAMLVTALILSFGTDNYLENNFVTIDNVRYMGRRYESDTGKYFVFETNSDKDYIAFYEMLNENKDKYEIINYEYDDGRYSHTHMLTYKIT